MLFSDLSILGLACEDAPLRVSSSELEERLRPTLSRLGLPSDILRSLTGIDARRFWSPGARPSEAATYAAARVLRETGLDPARVGVVISASVSRDCEEPATASFVHGNLGLSPRCRCFDLSNACLGFVDAISVAGALLQNGSIEAALVVAGENSGPHVDATVERLLSDGADVGTFKDHFASLTFGSGAVAALLGRTELARGRRRVTGLVSRSATEHGTLCQGRVGSVVTDLTGLLEAGLELAKRTFADAARELGWSPSALQHFFLHQVSATHTDRLVGTLELEDRKVHRIYPEFGNMGAASLPTTLIKAVESGKISEGDRIGLLGIGSGLNCAMLEIVW
jgi:3-oxoacyl-[acyl-carrier-protein] synthase-3